MAGRTIPVRALDWGVTLPEEATPQQILRAELCLLPSSPIPPRWVMQAVLGSGCSLREPAEWDAFQPGAEELEQAESALEAEGFRRMEPPEWVATTRQWTAWAQAVSMGAPPRAYVNASEREDNLRDEIQAALTAGDEERAAALHLERIRVANKLMRFMRRPGA